MRIAIDTNGTIANIIECDTLELAGELFPDAIVFEAIDVGIGWIKQPDGGYQALPPAPPAPRPLTQLEFIRLLQTVGGVTGQELVAADADPNLAEWWIKFRLATDIRSDDPDIVVGLVGLVALEYLTEAERLAVIDQWPTT